MAAFTKTVITENGQALIAEDIAGESNIEFTRIVTSDKEYSEDELETLESLDSIKQEGEITSISVMNKVAVRIVVAFSNTLLGEGYDVRAVGLYANDPDKGEILYGVALETTGTCNMPAYNGTTVVGMNIQLITTVGNAEDVVITVDPAGAASIADVSNLQEDLRKLVAYTVTIPRTGWSSSAPYTQTVEVDGVTDDWVPGNLVLVPTEDKDTDLAMQEAAGYISIIKSGNGEMTFICYEDLPTVNLEVRVPGLLLR